MQEEDPDGIAGESDGSVVLKERLKPSQALGLILGVASVVLLKQ